MNKLDARKLSQAVQESLRQQAIRLHESGRLWQEVSEEEERSKRLELFFLTPYAPMLNPDEYFNRDLKTALRLGPVTRTASAMRAKAEAFMAMLAKTPERHGKRC